MPETNSERSQDWWQSLWRKPKARWWLGIPAGGFVMFAVGIIFWGGFNTVLEASNSEAFCISCHEMRNTVYKELQKTIHYTNPSGVRATCADCHVPKEWIYKVRRKIRASFNELPGKILGTIDTPEKFEAKRLKLAEHVWAEMKATDSRECRNCHEMVSMDLENQGKSARKKHDPERLKDSPKTCIDCHKGIAHEMPKGYVEPEEKDASAATTRGG
ncbi:MAG: NapC/NirT family cytochrome c [Pseudomonadota bacterium]|nr:MAG: NapC/NirT family cytochrome c [Pseudomonadota bacterium]